MLHLWKIPKIQQLDEERTQQIYDESSRQKCGIIESPGKRAKVQIQGFDEIKELMIAQSKMIEVVARAASQAAEAAATAATVIAQAQARANLQSQVPGRQELEVAIAAIVVQNVTAATAAQVAMLTTTKNEEAQEVHDEQGMSDDKKIEELRKVPDNVNKELEKVMNKYSSRIIQYVRKEEK